MNITTPSQVKFFIVLSLVWYLNMALPHANMSVLIVDDDPTCRSLSAIFLRQFGIRDITMAENGAEAVLSCRLGITYDIIVMDFSMPLMNGVEVGNLIKNIISFHEYLQILIDLI